MRGGSSRLPCATGDGLRPDMTGNESLPQPEMVLFVANGECTADDLPDVGRHCRRAPRCRAAVAGVASGAGLGDTVEAAPVIVPSKVPLKAVCPSSCRSWASPSPSWSAYPRTRQSRAHVLARTSIIFRVAVPPSAPYAPLCTLAPREALDPQGKCPPVVGQARRAPIVTGCGRRRPRSPW